MHDEPWLVKDGGTTELSFPRRFVISRLTCVRCVRLNEAKRTRASGSVIGGLAKDFA